LTLAGEPGVEGVTVSLISSDTGATIATTLTDESGFYAFEGLAPGDYTVEFDLPDGYEFSPQDQGDDASDSDADAATGRTETITLLADEHNPRVDAGIFTSGFASLGDFVWYDENHDGIQNINETGIAGVTVSLINPATYTVIATTTTDGSGAYLFTELTPGDYAVQFELLLGYEYSPQNQGGNEASDSDPSTELQGTDASSGRTGVITLSPEEDHKETDAGMFISGTEAAYLLGTVWYDADENGIHDPSEPGVAGVKVNLLDPDSGRLIATATTDGSGEYEFAGLAPGEYMTEFVLPPGYEFTLPGQSDTDTSDSDAYPVTGQTRPFLLSAGENETQADAGIFMPDIEPASIGDFVWYDMNQNGIQEPDEPGISAVNVELYDSTGDTLTAMATTDEEGFYAFTGLAPGVYLLAFDPPEGYEFSPQNQGDDDALDSDADMLTRRASVNVEPGQGITHKDAGLYISAPISIGDLVWLDTDGDGLPSQGEGLPDVTLILYDGEGSRMRTTTTDANGNYSFATLPPGDYSVEVDTTTLPDRVQPFSDPDGVPDSVSDIIGQTTDTSEVDFGYRDTSLIFPDLSNTTKTVVDINGGTLEPGDVIWYAVTIYNAGTGSANSVVYADVPNPHTRILPDSVTTIRGTVVTGNSEDDNAIRTDIGTIAPEESVVITYYAQLDAETRPGLRIDNQGMVTGSNVPDEPTDFPSTGAFNDPTVIMPVSGIMSDANMEATKTATDMNNGDLEPGDTVEYRISIRNNGPDTAEDIVLFDSVPIHTTLIPGSLSTSQGTKSENSPLTVSMGDLDPGVTVSVSFQVTVNDDIAPNAMIVNQGVIVGTGGVQTVTDDITTPFRDDPTILSTPGDASQLEAYMTATDYNEGSVNPGDILKYTVTIINNSDEAMTGIVFRNQPDGHIALIPGTISNTLGTVTAGNGENDAAIAVDIGELAPGQSVTITFQALVGYEMPSNTNIFNQARVSSDEYPDEPTDDPSTFTEDDPTVLVGVWEPGAFDPPSAYKTASGDEFVIYWEMIWINDKNEDALLVHIEDDIPAEVTYIPDSLEADYGTYWYDEEANKVIWEGSIPGNSGQVKIWYHTPVPEGVSQVENQAYGLWDRNGDGDWRDEEAQERFRAYTDNPVTIYPGDATLWHDGSHSLSIGNMIWHDTDIDGIYSRDSETGINRVRVSLYQDTDGNGEFTPGTDVFLRETMSFTYKGEPGWYVFENLPEGEYVVQIAPENFEVSGVLNGYFGSPGDSDPDNDIDNDENGSYADRHGVVSMAVTLTAGLEPVNDGDIDANTNLSVDFGFYHKGVPAPGFGRLRLGNMIWHDSNGDGVYSADTETGINDIRVNLYYDSDGSGDFTPGADEFLAETVSATYEDEAGRYLFDDLSEDDYIVQIAPENFTCGGILGGYSSSPGYPDPDDDINDDDNGEVMPGHGMITKAVTLIAGTEPTDDGDIDPNTNLTADFGVYQTGAGCACSLSLGSGVWNDMDNDGIWATGESGIDDVRMNLYRDSDGSGDYTPGEDEFLMAAISFTLGDTSGNYVFQNLDEGDYIIQIAPENFDEDGALNWHVSSPGSPDPDDNIDNDDNGEFMAGHGVVTKAVTLTVGCEPVNDGDADSGTNLTVDFGFYGSGPQPGACDLSLEGLIWDDADSDGVRQPESEAGIDDVRFNLYLDADGSGGFTPGADEFVAAAVSFAADGESGHYAFYNLCEGSYIVQADTANFEAGGPLNNYSRSTGNAVSGYGVVSEIIEVTDEDETVSGFGFYQPVTEGSVMKPF